MYHTNQSILLWLKATSLLGIPMLCSFVLPQWVSWKIPSMFLFLIVVYFNNRYPDQIYLDEMQVQVKLFFSKEVIIYTTSQVTFMERPTSLFIYIDGKDRYVLQKRECSVRLYQQIQQLLSRQEK